MVPKREEGKGMYTEDDLLPEENGPEPHFYTRKFTNKIR